MERPAEGGPVVKCRTPGVRWLRRTGRRRRTRVFVLDYHETPGWRTMDGHERLVTLDEET